MLMSMLNLVYIAYCYPLENLVLNRLEVFNELTILGVGMILPTFTDMVSHPVIKDEAGWALNALVLGNLGVNIVYILYRRAIDIYQAVKRWLWRRKHAPRLNQIRAAKEEAEKKKQEKKHEIVLSVIDEDE